MRVLQIQDALDDLLLVLLQLLLVLLDQHLHLVPRKVFLYVLTHHIVQHHRNGLCDDPLEHHHQFHGGCHDAPDPERVFGTQGLGQYLPENSNEDSRNDDALPPVGHI